MPFKKPHQTADPTCITKKDGNRVIEIPPKGLNIIWGNDTRYWTTAPDGSAELIQVSWLEVSGKVHVDKGRYVVKFLVSVNSNGFGWEGTQVLVMAKLGKKGKYEYKEVTLKCGEQNRVIPDTDVSVTVEGNPSDPELHFGLYEVWSGKWKGGLIIKKAEVIKAD